MAELQQKGISRLICLLEVYESRILGLTQEKAACEAAAMYFERFEIPDYGIPRFTELYSLVGRLTTTIAAGDNIVVHCRGGIGRTGLICCCLAIASGMDLKSAISNVSAQRGCTVPETDAQLAMIDQFALRWRSGQ